MVANGKAKTPKPAAIFAAVEEVHRRCKGGYAVVLFIAGVGLLAFRDIYGIRPLVYGARREKEKTEYMVASESVALQVGGLTSRGTWSRANAYSST